MPLCVAMTAHCFGDSAASKKKTSTRSLQKSTQICLSGAPQDQSMQYQVSALSGEVDAKDTQNAGARGNERCNHRIIISKSRRAPVSSLGATTQRIRSKMEPHAVGIVPAPKKTKACCFNSLGPLHWTSPRVRRPDF